ARIPWAALPGAKAGRFLLEDYALALVPVPQLLPELLAAPKDAKDVNASLLALGGVDFGSAAGGAAPGRSKTAPRSGGKAALKDWPELPATRGEVLALCESFEQKFPEGTVKMLLRGAATEAAFPQLAPRHRYPHL